ncbi:MAG: hypothetical protein M0R22_01020 [Dehalococcoidia bacterium]|nr:hypothetical protein [Dehalococcoidia bacterium]
MADPTVSESLCEARRAETDRRLETIERDVGETRQGVGKLIRVLLEGNGQPSFSSRLSTIEGAVGGLQKNERERLDEEKSTRKQRIQTRLAIWLAIGSGIVTIVGKFIQF